MNKGLITKEHITMHTLLVTVSPSNFLVQITHVLNTHFTDKPYHMYQYIKTIYVLKCSLQAKK